MLSSLRVIFPTMNNNQHRSVSWILMVACVFQIVYLTKLSSATKMHSVHWNTSNPIFRIDNTDHIIDVNKGNIRFEYDQVNIICPVYNNDGREDDVEKYIIYNVSKEEYDSCRITTPSPRIIAVCDKPGKVLYFTITFRPFSPQPGGLEFRPGKDYYFISTSSREDLYRKIGGRCTTHHMKVVFKVCCDPSAQPAHDQANGHLLTNSLSTPLGVSSTVSTTLKLSSATKRISTSTQIPSTTKPTTKSPPPASAKFPPQINKGLKPYTGAKSSKTKKKAVQNELTKTNAATSPRQRWYSVLLLCTLLTIVT